GPANLTVCPLRTIGPPDEHGNQPHHYWSFATSDLYNWRTQHAKFSDNPRDLINLLETVLFTHQPTWDDCQQLLQALFFTSEERERIRGQAIKSVLGGTEGPLDEQQQARIEAQLPSTRPLRRWTRGNHGWWMTKEGNVVLPATVADTLLRELHKSTHLDLVFIRRFDSKTLEPRWKGLVPAVLSTPLVVKVAGHSAWIHCNHLKAGPPVDIKKGKWKVISQPGDQKLRLER
ncbi:Gag polyprotein, partial [Heterocephalus glaber]